MVWGGGEGCGCGGDWGGGLVKQGYLGWAVVGGQVEDRSYVESGEVCIEEKLDSSSR